MSIRALRTIEHIEELPLGESVANALLKNRCGVRDVIMAVRSGATACGGYPIRLRHIGSKKWAAIEKAVDEAGFLLHESVSAERVRSLLKEIFVSMDLAEGYERQRPLTESQQNKMQNILHQNLTYMEYTIIRAKFGLDGREPRRSFQILAEMGLDWNTFNQFYKQAMACLRSVPIRRELVEAFPDFAGVTEADVERVQRYHGPIEQVSIEELKLPSYVCRRLQDAKITTVGQLQAMPEYKLLRIPRIGQMSAIRIGAALAELNEKRNA